jgi:energy-converting hydrogenase Eha subunit G
MYFYVNWIAKGKILCTSSIKWTLWLATYIIHIPDSHLPCMHTRSMCKVISSIKMSFVCYKLTNVAWTHWNMPVSGTLLHPNQNLLQLVIWATLCLLPVALYACLFSFAKICEICKSFVLCTTATIFFFFISYVTKSNYLRV